MKPLLRLAMLTVAVMSAMPARTALAQTDSSLPVKIRIDTIYRARQTAAMSFDVPLKLRPELDYTFLRVRPVGSTDNPPGMRTCGWPVANGADRPCEWTVPSEPGLYELYMTGAHTKDVDKVYGSTVFRVEGIATTPTALGFVKLRNPAAAGNTLADFEEVSELIHDEAYPVIAVFEPVPGDKGPESVTVRGEWLVWSDILNDYESKELSIVAERKAPWLYVSAPVQIRGKR